VGNVIRRPLSFVLYSTGHGTLIVNQNDYHRWSDGYEYGVGLSLARNSWFDPEEVALALRLLRLRREHFGDGVVALDCGANIGVHSVEWAREMHDWGRVHAFEAQEPIFYALCGNLVINNCLNASAKHLALGAEAGTINVPKIDYHKPGSFGSLELRLREGTEYVGQDVDYSAEAGTPVQMAALDSFGFDRVDFVKIDVEGMEAEVLEGAARLIETCKPILMLEYVKSDSNALMTYFRSLSYNVYQMGMNLVLVHESDPSGVGII
jgi:FkbM family methyltransferase